MEGHLNELQNIIKHSLRRRHHLQLDSILSISFPSIYQRFSTKHIEYFSHRLSKNHSSSLLVPKSANKINKKISNKGSFAYLCHWHHYKFNRNSRLAYLPFGYFHHSSIYHTATSWDCRHCFFYHCIH